MKKFFAWWRQYQIDHPVVAGAFVVVESAAAGVVVDLIMNGYDFSHGGWKHVGTLMGTAVVVALRNYFKSNASNLKLKMGAENKEKEN